MLCTILVLLLLKLHFKSHYYDHYLCYNLPFLHSNERPIITVQIYVKKGILLNEKINMKILNSFVASPNYFIFYIFSKLLHLETISTISVKLFHLATMPSKSFWLLHLATHLLNESEFWMVASIFMIVWLVECETFSITLLLRYDIQQRCIE